MVVIVTVLLGMFSAAMEALITATILPSIISSLGGMELYPWIINSFLLSFIVVTPIYGKMSDTYGYKQVYLAAVLIFCLSSLLCASAQSMHQLIFFRGLQGMGTGGLITMSIIFFGEIFPLEKRPKMQALLSSMWAIASLLGPMIGALLVQTLSWRWAFFINVPSAIAIFFLILFFARQNKFKEDRKPFDAAGLGLFVLFSSTAVISIMGISRLSPTFYTFLSLAVCAVSGTFFISHLFKRHHPFIPVSLLKRKEVALSVSMGFFCGFFLFCTANFLPMYVQGVLGLEPQFAGKVVTVIALGSFSGSLISGFFLNRAGFRAIASGGALSVSLGFAALTLILQAPALWKLSLCSFFVGVGISSIANSSIIAAQAASPKGMIGGATSMFHFFRSFGGLVGISAMGGMQLGVFRKGLQHLIDQDHLQYGGLSQFLQNPEQIFNPYSRMHWNGAEQQAIPEIFGDSFHPIFLSCFIVGLAAFYLTRKMPKRRPRDYSIAEDPIPLEE